MRLKIKSSYYIMTDNGDGDAAVELSRTMFIARRSFGARKSVRRLTRERGRSYYSGHIDERGEKVISGKWVRYETAQ